MFTRLDQFIEEWNGEAASTQKVLHVLTNESLQQQVAPDQFTLGKLAWHMTLSVHYFLSAAGLEFPAEGDWLAFQDQGKGGEQPTSATAIKDAYGRTSRAMLDALKTQWSDTTLSETRMMWGMLELPVSAVLRMLIQHQTHHRGQMFVLMRQAGLVVPGVYGPSREERQQRDQHAHHTQ